MIRPATNETQTEQPNHDEKDSKWINVNSCWYDDIELSLSSFRFVVMTLIDKIATKTAARMNCLFIVGAVLETSDMVVLIVVLD